MGRMLTARSEFDPAPPPRAVPLTVRGVVMFGGIFSIMGFAFLSIGLLSTAIFVFNADFSVFQFTGKLDTAKGTVTSVERTSFSSGKGSSKSYVYENSYEFKAPDGNKYSDKSYAYDQLRHGDVVTVEFTEGNPKLSRIQGMGRSPMPWWVGLFVLIFPVVGAFMTFAGLRQGKRSIRLLRHGCVEHGVLKSKDLTSGKVNNRPIYSMTFEFTARDGRTFTANSNTYMPELLEDDPKERLLYDPNNPKLAVMYDSLPGTPGIGPRGEILPCSFVKFLLLLILPLLTILVILGEALYLLAG